MYLPSERGPIARVRVECIRSLTSYIPLTRGFLSSFPDRCRGFTHADCYWRQVRIWTAAAVNSWTPPSILAVAATSRFRYRRAAARRPRSMRLVRSAPTEDRGTDTGEFASGSHRSSLAFPRRATRFPTLATSLDARVVGSATELRSAPT